MGEPVLEAEGVGKRYGKHWAVRHVTFSLERGEVLGVIGENGAGKSTLLSLLATLQRPNEGTLRFCGRDMVREKKKCRPGIGYVPQEIALFEELSGRDNLEFFAKAYHLTRQECKQRIGQLCEITAFPQEWLSHRVSEYSGGMKRKINISAAMLHSPELLLLDEPTANLDFASEEQIIDVVKTLAKEGTAVVYVGHQPDVTEQLCSRFCLLKDGEPELWQYLDELHENHPGVSLKQLCRERK